MISSKIQHNRQYYDTRKDITFSVRARVLQLVCILHAKQRRINQVVQNSNGLKFDVSVLKVECQMHALCTYNQNQNISRAVFKPAALITQLVRAVPMYGNHLIQLCHSGRWFKATVYTEVRK